MPALDLASVWVDRSHLIADHHASHRPDLGVHVVSAHFNDVYAVQRYQYDEHPGIDHLMVSRHDQGTICSWPDLQAIKDRLAPDGQMRTAVQVHPPRLLVVDDRNIYHLWVMPAGWTLGIGLHPDDVGSTTKDLGGVTADVG